VRGQLGKPHRLRLVRVSRCVPLLRRRACMLGCVCALASMRAHMWVQGHTAFRRFGAIRRGLQASAWRWRWAALLRRCRRLCRCRQASRSCRYGDRQTKPSALRNALCPSFLGGSVLSCPHHLTPCRCGRLGSGRRMQRPHSRADGRRRRARLRRSAGRPQSARRDPGY
jgi:hypothetical protein